MTKKFSRQGLVIADLGSGPGYYTIPFAKSVGLSGTVYAVDFNERAISRLQNKAEREGLGQIIKAYASSAAKVDFIPDGSVDFVFAHGLLCCMADHQGALMQIKRILKPTGSAYLSVTKIPRKNDPLSVNSEEWESILSGFKIVERGEGIFTRWAVVSPS